MDGKLIIFLATPFEITSDKQKILVGKVFVNDIDVTLSHISEGFSWQNSRDEKYLNATDKQSYAKAELSAKVSKRGIWSDSFKPCKETTVKTSVVTTNKLNSEITKRPEVFGSVTVELVIAEAGDVLSARALCGHPVLQTEAVKAALRAKFVQQPTRIKGNLVYNFVP